MRERFIRTRRSLFVFTPQLVRCRTALFLAPQMPTVLEVDAWASAYESDSNLNVRKNVALRRARCVSSPNADLCAGRIEQGGRCGLSRGYGRRRLGRRALDRRLTAGYV